MSTDLEAAVAESLRSGVDGPVDVEMLRTVSIGRARRIRYRRIGGAAAGLALAVLAAASLAPVWSGSGPSRQIGDPSPGPSTAAPVVGLTVALPAATVPGAALRPDLVGRDPAVLHFDVDLTGLDATGASWSVEDGVERLSVWTGAVNHFTLWYTMSTDPEKVRDSTDGIGPPAETRELTVRGRPAQAKYYPGQHGPGSTPWTLTWQPVDGLWVHMKREVVDPADLVVAAEALRLDRSQRCVVPMRLSAVPANTTWTGCNANFGPYRPWEAGGLTFTGGPGASAQTVRVDIGWFSPTGADKFVPTHTVAGRPAMLWREGAMTQLFVPLSDWVSLVVVVHRRDGAPEVADADLVAVAASVIPGTDVANPSTWPERPVL